MAQTIEGGFYIGQDGQPHDAEGRPVAPRIAKDAKRSQGERADQSADAGVTSADDEPKAKGKK